MSTKASAAALEWNIRKQDKFDGAKIRTRQKEDGTYEIFEWVVAGVPQPTESEVDTIVSQFENKTEKETWEKTKENLLQEQVTDLITRVKKLEEV